MSHQKNPPFKVQLSLDSRPIQESPGRELPGSIEKTEQFHLLFPDAICFPVMPHFLLLHTTGGKAVYQASGLTMDLCPHTLLFAECDRPFQVAVKDSSHWSAEGIYIQGSVASVYYHYFSQNGEICYSYIKDGLLSDMFHNTILQWNQLSKNPYYHLAPVLQFKTVVELLTTLLVEKETISPSPLRTPHYLIAIKQLLDDDPAASYSLEQIAAKFHVSKTKLIYDFYQHFQITPIAYLIRSRIKYAMQLLSTTDQSITEISSACGMNNINNFTRHFKKAVGITPSAYRRLLNPQG